MLFSVVFLESSSIVFLALLQVDRLGRELLGQTTASEQAGLDLEVLTQELELERRNNRDLPHEIRAAEAHKAETLDAKVGRNSHCFRDAFTKDK